jgi:hypothetical protein
MLLFLKNQITDRHWFDFLNTLWFWFSQNSRTEKNKNPVRVFV